MGVDWKPTMNNQTNNIWRPPTASRRDSGTVCSGGFSLLSDVKLSQIRAPDWGSILLRPNNVVYVMSYISYRFVYLMFA